MRLRPIVGDVVDFHYYTDAVRCEVIEDHTRHPFAYEPGIASLTLRTEYGAEGRAMWSRDSDRLSIDVIETNWAMRLLACCVAIARARVAQHMATQRALRDLRHAGLL